MTPSSSLVEHLTFLPTANPAIHSPLSCSVIPTNITIDNLDQFSLYDVLGLGSWGSSVDCDTIKKAYHKAVLLYHPDKQQNTAACEEDARAIFLKIQEAHTVLSNDDKRKAYDSQLDFDETIPTETETREASKRGTEAFCALYDPVFKTNARFALKKPVPSIGGLDTNISAVQKFYEYWINFDSWRDFVNVNAEHKPDSATSREEKRWMIKENEKGAKKLKKKEMGRINEMVLRAMENDPRLLAEKGTGHLPVSSVSYSLYLLFPLAPCPACPHISSLLHLPKKVSPSLISPLFSAITPSSPQSLSHSLCLDRTYSS